MVSVFFNCSSPYVGYTLRKADYVREAMLPCTKNDMTSIGYTVFNNSGSFMVLGTFDRCRYFHTRQSQSEQYDEQGRRIYSNVAFAAENPADASVVNAIAAYVFFEEEDFYKEMANMITLLDDGFTVDFKKLAGFIRRFEKPCGIETASEKARRFFHSIKDADGTYTIDFIVRESTWNYFVKQVRNDFNNSVNYQFSYSEAKILAQSGKFRFPDNAPGLPDHSNQEKEKDFPKPAKEIRSSIDVEDTVKEIPSSKNAEEETAEKELHSEDAGRTAASKETIHETSDSVCVLKAPSDDAADSEIQQQDIIEKAVRLVEQMICLKNKLTRYFWLGFATGIIGTVLAVLIITKLI